MTVEYISRKLRCPVCNAEFMVETPTGIRPVAQETDFRPVFARRDPIAAELHACSSCRYAGYAIAFEREDDDEEEDVERLEVPPPLDPMGIPDEDDLDDLRRWIRRGGHLQGLDVDERDPTPAERYLLAARCREYLGDENHLAIADLYHRGAWCARAAGEAVEARLLRDAAGHLAAALEAGRVPDEEKGRVLYLAAELSRRAGDFARAVDLFGQVDAALDLEDEEGLQLHRLARRQEALAQVKSAVNARMPAPDGEGEDPPRRKVRRRLASDEGEE